VRRVQEKLAAKKEQQQREREAERAIEEAKNAEREQEKERVKQEKMERREKLRVEREEAKAKGPEEYERWRQARRTMSCNSETADAEVELPQLYPNLMSSNPSSESIASTNNTNNDSDTNIEHLTAEANAVFHDTDEPIQEDDPMSFHPPQAMESEFMTNYTSEPVPYPWQPAQHARSRAPPGMMQQQHLPPTTWTCQCSLINASTSLSCARCGVLRFQAESAERNLSFLSMDQPRFSGFQQQEAGPTFGGWGAGGAVNGNGSKLASPIIEPSRNLAPHLPHLEGLENMTRSHSTQAPNPHQPQPGHANGLLAASRFPSSESAAMFRNFNPQHAVGLGNGVFEVPSAASERSHFAVPEKPAFHTVDELLESLNLSCLSSIFSAEDIDLAALKLLKNSHLTDMGIKLGPRVKLMKAIESL